MNINNAIEILQRHYEKQFAKIDKQNENLINYFYHKIKHSYWVLQCAYRIIAKTPQLNNASIELKERLIVWALLHDVGRFYQHNWERLLQNHEFDHWNASSEILRKEWITDVWLLLSAKYHNKHDWDLKNIPNELEFKALNKPEQEETMIIIKLVRDADKLDNIEFSVYDKMRINENFAKWMKYGYKKWWITKKILDEFLDWKVSWYGMEKTFWDEVLQFGSWVNDINYTWTRELIKEIWFWWAVIKYLKSKNITENIDKIENYFNKL